MVLWFSGAAKGLDGVVEVWHEAFDSLILVLDQALGGCGCDEAMLKIPAKVLDDCGNHVKIDGSFQKLVGSSMNTVIIEGVAGCLEHESFSKGMGQAKNIITDQGGPNLKELLSLLEHKVLHLCSHVLDFNRFLQVNQVLESYKLCDVIGCSQMSFSCFRDCRKDMKTLLGVRKNIFDHFLHENAIVSLCSHARVSTSNTECNSIDE